MPIIIPKDLPAYEKLKSEKVFVIDDDRAVGQDIRPIEIAIVNLMPAKEVTETQLLRLIANTPLQVNVTFVKTDTYTPTHVSKEHMGRFYKSLDEVRKLKFDGMIVTGAPVENMPFEQVAYWNEFEQIVSFAKENVTSTIYICWGAQAALYSMFGIQKVCLDKKLFGVFPTYAVAQGEPLLKGTDDVFYIPNSRYTAIDEQKAKECVEVLAYSDEAGIAIAKTKDNKAFFFTGHSEYDRYTLRDEYLRDVERNIPIEKPENYFVGADRVDMKWKSTANLLFFNWLNYYVYQVTPYNL